MNRPRLLIAEDHPDTQDVLRELLEPDHDIVGLVSDGQAALDAAAKLDPDLVLLDISMPRLGGIAAARQLQRSMPALKFIFVTAHADPLYVDEAFRIGARGYVLKQAMISDLLDAVREVLAGGTYRSARVAGHVA